MRRFLRLVPLCGWLLLVGCPGSSSSPDPAPPTAPPDAPPKEPPHETDTSQAGLDSDQDGLDDASEGKLGTSPRLTDTDGDGYSDGQELLELGFDPAINPYRFNPRIADVPRIDVRVQSAPKVYIHHTTSKGQGRSFDNSRSAEESQGFSTERGGSTSLRMEVSATVGVEVSSTVGVMPGTTVGGSYSSTFSAATESSFNWSSSQSRENRNTVSESQSFSQTQDVTQSGGRVEVAVEIINLGNIGCTLQTMALGLRKLDPGTGRYVEIGQLEPESDRTFLDVTSLAPGERIDGLVFRAELSLEKAELLLGPGPMAVRTLHFELLDEDRRSFDHRVTQIAARTSPVTIDPGDGAVPRTWLVATYSPDGTGLPLAEALSSVLRIPFEEGTTLWRGEEGVGSTKRGFLRVGNVATSSADGGHWTVEVWTDDGSGGRQELYDPLKRDLDVAALRLVPARAVSLVYVSDADRDGLGARTERVLGLDPQSFDTDGDGRGDGDELKAGRNPLLGRARVEIARVQSVERRLTLVLDARRGEDAAIEEVAVDWGDGSPRETFDEAPDTVRHEYPDYGTYSVAVAARETGSPESTSQAVAGPRVRIRLQPALVEAWQLEELGDLAGGLGPAVIAAPDGGAFVSVFLRSGPKNEGPHWCAARISSRGSVVWSRIVAPASSDEIIKQHLHGRRLALAPNGRTIYGTGEDRVVALDAASGEPKWDLTPHRDNSMKVRRLSLAMAPSGRLYVAGKASKNETDREHTFLSRIDPGAALAFSRAIEGTDGDLAPYPAVGPQGQVLLASGSSILIVDEGGESLGRLDHAAASVLGLIPLEGKTIVAGMAVHSTRTADGGEGRSLVGGVWEYDSEGNVTWGHAAPPASATSTQMLFGLTRDAAGRYLGPEISSSRIDPEGGDTMENRRLTLQIAAWSPEGDRLFAVPVAGLRSDLGLALLMFNYSIDAGPQGAVLFGWTETQVSETGTKPKPEDVTFRPRVACWAPNPTPTAILTEDR